MTLNPHRIPHFLMRTANQDRPELERLARDLGAQFARCLEGMPGQMADRNLDQTLAGALVAGLWGKSPKDIQEAAARDPLPRDAWMGLSLYQAMFLKPGPACDALSAHLASGPGLEQAFADNTVQILALRVDRLSAGHYGEKEGQDADDQAALDFDEKIQQEWERVCGSWRPIGLGIFTDLVLRILFQAFRFAAWSLRSQDDAAISLAGDLARNLGTFIPLGEHREHAGTWVVLVRRVTPAPSPTLPST